MAFRYWPIGGSSSSRSGGGNSRLPRLLLRHPRLLLLLAAVGLLLLASHFRPPTAAVTPSHDKGMLQQRIAEMEGELLRLHSDTEQRARWGKTQGQELLRLSGERDALKERNAELEAAIRDGQYGAKRPSLPFTTQPPLRMPAWTLDHRFYALGAILTRDQV